MHISLSRVRDFAVESPAGRVLFITAASARAQAAVTTYSRACALLRAWRISNHPLVRRRAQRFLDRSLKSEGKLVLLRHNPILSSFVRSTEAKRIRKEFARYDEADRLRLRFPLPHGDPRRQGDLIILKASNPAKAEKGVLLIKYTEAFTRFAALFEIERLVERYIIVLEPSWWGYQDASFFLFSGRDSVVVVQAPAKTDYDFLATNDYGLRPLRVGAGSWIDPANFSPSGEPTQYDIVMVSSWSPFKCHRDLISAVAEVKASYGRTIKVALVGYPNGWTAQDIRSLIEQYGVADQFKIFDRISQNEVARIVSASKYYLLLSRREGANKAMYEAMFCDTPVLAPRDHRGINHDDVRGADGMTFDRKKLSDALLSALDEPLKTSPRSWALKNTGYLIATERLNSALADLAQSRGENWTTPIVPKMNCPNLWYASDDDRQRLAHEYINLADYLRRD